MLSISNNWVENQIRPIAIGMANWLFAGSLRSDLRRGRDELGALGSYQRHDPYANQKATAWLGLDVRM